MQLHLHVLLPQGRHLLVRIGSHQRGGIQRLLLRLCYLRLQLITGSLLLLKTLQGIAWAARRIHPYRPRRRRRRGLLAAQCLIFVLQPAGRCCWIMLQGNTFLNLLPSDNPLLLAARELHALQPCSEGRFDECCVGKASKCITFSTRPVPTSKLPAVAAAHEHACRRQWVNKGVLLRIVHHTLQAALATTCRSLTSLGLTSRGTPPSRSLCGGSWLGSRGGGRLWGWHVLGGDFGDVCGSCSRVSSPVCSTLGVYPRVLRVFLLAVFITLGGIVSVLGPPLAPPGSTKHDPPRAPTSSLLLGVEILAQQHHRVQVWKHNVAVQAVDLLSGHAGIFAAAFPQHERLRH